MEEEGLAFLKRHGFTLLLIRLNDGPEDDYISVYLYSTRYSNVLFIRNVVSAMISAVSH